VHFVELNIFYKKNGIKKNTLQKEGGCAGGVRFIKRKKSKWILMGNIR